MALLEAIDIKKSYGKLPILNGISLEVQAAEVVAILGLQARAKVRSFKFWERLTNLTAAKFA